MNRDRLLEGFIIWFGILSITYLFFAFTSMSWDYLSGDNQGGRFFFGLWGSIWGWNIFAAVID